MATALDRIISYKREEVSARKAGCPLAELEARAADRPPPRGFAAALDRVAMAGENALICELKRRSPSAGEILPGADPVEIARQYEAGGAACLSVLTDGPSFGGTLGDLDAIAAAVGLPLLRKDFMVDPWQVHEARAHGADAILVIMAAVNDAQAGLLVTLAVDLGMDVLVEVHDKDELGRALALPAGLVGINNRNLRTMTTDLAVTEALAPCLPAGRALVSESGVKTPADIIRLQAAGARRFLIGESLMTQTDREQAVAELRQAVNI
ncbi:MAG: indole-3-glycerol phosphate synthase TrpC [Alphaproteobacteria bacterium]|jgi:indole-3-glycerol phosphate synthase|nr:indole-3-glycerol phosphate synthase TrpC [Alphaproteobacteria bacterium]